MKNTCIVRSVVSFITNEEQQENATKRCQCQPYVLDPKALGDLTQQPIDRQSNDEEEVKVDEGESVAVGDTGVTSKLAKTQPECAILCHFSSWADVAKSLVTNIQLRNKNDSKHKNSRTKTTLT